MEDHSALESTHRVERVLKAAVRALATGIGSRNTREVRTTLELTARARLLQQLAARVLVRSWDVQAEPSRSANPDAVRTVSAE